MKVPAILALLVLLPCSAGAWEKRLHGDLETMASSLVQNLKPGPLYRTKPEYWQNLLRQHIMKTADALKPHKQPLMTTECWGVVDFKDWPLLNWDWVKDLCRIGVETAAATGQWVAIASSNFCGPQFKGMWRDVEWHHAVTSLIKSSPILPELRETKIARRL